MPVSTKPAKKSKPRSDFLAWFEAQAGKGPTTQGVIDQRLALVGKRIQCAVAEADLAAAERYQLIKQYALYAWCAGVAHGQKDADRLRRKQKGHK